MSEAEVLERVSRLRGERIIRQVSAIFDTRKLGYTSMLVAARTAPERRRRGRRGDQRAPRRHAQLPARARVQHLVHAGRPADLAARARPHRRAARRAGRGRGDPAAAGAALLQDRRRPRHEGRARSGRQEAAAGADARRAAAGRDRRARHRRDPRAADRPARRRRAVRRPGRAARVHGARAVRGGRALPGDRPDAALRRGALPPLGRVHLQRHGRVEGAGRPDGRDRLADGVVPRRVALLPAADVPGLAVQPVLDDARAHEEGVRGRARRDRGRDRPRRAGGALLDEGVEEDAARLLQPRRRGVGAPPRPRAPAGSVGYPGRRAPSIRAPFGSHSRPPASVLLP